MARYLSQKPLIPQDENLGFLKKEVISGKLKASKPESKKGVGGLGNRKALGDITNKASINRESLSKKKDTLKEEFNIAEEKILHDHKKCVEAQQASKILPSWDVILPGYDPKSSVDIANLKLVKVQHDEDFFNERSYSEPVEIEIDSPRNSSSAQLFQPPMSLDSPPDYSFAMNFDPVEFTLMEEDVS